MIKAGEHQITRAIDHHRAKERELRVARRRAVGRRTRLTSAGNRLDDAGRRIPPTDALVEAVAEDERAIAVEYPVVRAEQHRLRRRTAVAREAALFVADHSGDDAAARVDATN